MVRAPIAFAMLLAGCHAAAAPCAPAAGVSEVADGVFLRPGVHAGVFEADAVANIGFVIGSRCVAVIDTGGSAEEGRALGCAIRSRTDKPVCYVVNTHVHPDHILGNSAFADGDAQFVGHANLPRAMALLGGIYLPRAEAYAGRPLGEHYIVMPDRLVEESLELDLGDRRLVVTAQPSAHTDNDVSVYDSRTGTLWLGDLLFREHVPVVDASLTGWLDVLGRLQSQPARHVVPGHGPASSDWPAAARDTLRYLNVLRDETRRWIAQGGSLREAQLRVARGEAEHWLLFDAYHARNVSAAFRELEWED